MAFDKVSHNLLIHILNYYGIHCSSKTANWIENWLDGRKHSDKESYIRYRKHSQELLEAPH